MYIMIRAMTMETSGAKVNILVRDHIITKFTAEFKFFYVWHLKLFSSIDFFFLSNHKKYLTLIILNVNVFIRNLAKVTKHRF